MGQPVVHFEIIGKDAESRRSYYSDLFGWEFDSDNPMNYGIVQREGNTNADGVGIGGGVGAAPEGYTGHVTVSPRAPARAGAAASVPTNCGRRARPSATGRASP